MTADTELHELVREATLAPSPDNNQPWHFEALPSGELLVCHDLTRALPSDVDYMFSMIALGAALENLVIAARQHGWEPRVEYLPQADTPGTEGRVAVAQVRSGGEGRPDPLYPFLATRVTCRKPYHRQPVAEALLRDLEASVTGFPGLQLHWASARADVRTLARLVASSDRVRLEYPSFHAELFRQLRFTAEEAEATRDGLDLRTLEISPRAAPLLRALRSWGRMRLANRLGFSRFLSWQSALLVWRTGTIGLLTTADTSREGYLQAGRGLQRVWLTATKLGLAFHPLGSIPIYLSLIARQGGGSLLPKHHASLERVAQKLFRVFPKTEGQGLVLLFRLGEAPVPAVRSLRRPVAEVFQPAAAPAPLSA